MNHARSREHISQSTRTCTTLLMCKQLSDELYYYNEEDGNYYYYNEDDVGYEQGMHKCIVCHVCDMREVHFGCVSPAIGCKQTVIIVNKHDQLLHF